MSTVSSPRKRRKYGLTGPRELWNKAIAYSKTDTRYAAILQACAENGWPEAFQADVYVHDLAFCREYPDVQLVFVLRDSGSHCYLIGDECNGAREWARDVISYHSGEHKLNQYGPDDTRARFFHVTHDGAEELTWQQAQELVATVPA